MGFQLKYVQNNLLEIKFSDEMEAGLQISQSARIHCKYMYPPRYAKYAYKCTFTHSFQPLLFLNDVNQNRNYLEYLICIVHIYAVTPLCTKDLPKKSGYSLTLSFQTERPSSRLCDTQSTAILSLSKNCVSAPKQKINILKYNIARSEYENRQGWHLIIRNISHLILMANNSD